MKEGEKREERRKQKNRMGNARLDIRGATCPRFALLSSSMHANRPTSSENNRDLIPTKTPISGTPQKGTFFVARQHFFMAHRHALNSIASLHSLDLLSWPFACGVKCIQHRAIKIKRAIVLPLPARTALSHAGRSSPPFVL